MQSPMRPARDTCVFCTLRPFVFYTTGAREEALAVFELRKGIRTFPGKSSLYREGELAFEYFTVMDGWAFRFKLLPDGRRQILSFLLPGDSISYQLMRTDRLHFSVQALTDVVACVFDRRTLARYVAERPALVERLDRLNDQALAAADDRLVDLGRRSAHERMAGFFLQLHDRLHQRDRVRDGTFAFPLRQQHIADALGLTSVHVSRVLKDLRADDVISIEAERLTVHDLPLLRKLANQGDRADEQLH